MYLPLFWYQIHLELKWMGCFTIEFPNPYDDSFNYNNLKTQRQIQWSNWLYRLIILCTSLVMFTQHCILSSRNEFNYRLIKFVFGAKTIVFKWKVSILMLYICLRKCFEISINIQIGHVTIFLDIISSILAFSKKPIFILQFNVYRLHGYD